VYIIVTHFQGGKIRKPSQYLALIGKTIVLFAYFGTFVTLKPIAASTALRNEKALFNICCIGQ
jgi:hypothetical protein